MSDKPLKLLSAKKFSKAAFVGAKTVNDPSESSVESKPAACSAETKILKSFDSLARAVIVVY